MAQLIGGKRRIICIRAITLAAQRLESCHNAISDVPARDAFAERDNLSGNVHAEDMR